MHLFVILLCFRSKQMIAEVYIPLSKVLRCKPKRKTYRNNRWSGYKSVHASKWNWRFCLINPFVLSYFLQLRIQTGLHIIYFNGKTCLLKISLENYWISLASFFFKKNHVCYCQVKLSCCFYWPALLSTYVPKLKISHNVSHDGRNTCHALGGSSGCY